jgi:aryl-alcohol dehydrogenase-like predicted oxidoreductase
VSLGSWLTFGGGDRGRGRAACIEKAYDLGINFFDTANVYARGKSEEVVGRVLANYARDSSFSPPRCTFPMGDGPNDKGCRASTSWSSATSSLKRWAPTTLTCTRRIVRHGACRSKKR